MSIEEKVKNYAENNPLVNAQKVAEDLCISRQTASRYLVRLTKTGFLKEMSLGGTRVFVIRAMIDDYEAKRN